MPGPILRLLSAAFVVTLVAVLAGCAESTKRPATSTATATGSASSTTTTTQRTVQQTTTAAGDAGTSGKSTTVTTGSTRLRGSASSYGYTYGQPSGNRVVGGTGDLPSSRPVDVRLGGTPTWVVGVPLDEGTAWVVTLEDGRVEAYKPNGNGKLTPYPITPDRLPSGEPPLVKMKGDSLKLITARGVRTSKLTAPIPVPLDKENALVGVREDGGLFVERGSGLVESLPVEALPDARLARSESGMVATLSDPTGSYPHGAIGDELEARAMTLLKPAGKDLTASGRIRPASGGIFESNAPLWFRMPGVKGEVLPIAETSPEKGARVSVYAPSGELVAAGPFIGERFKWRHVLAAGPFGPNGETEVAATRTPHVGPRIAFYRPDKTSKELKVSASLPGYTSHRIYTRNMDTIRAGDLDGDGRWELLVPNEDYTTLAAVRHEKSGARVAWTLPAGGVISTNLASVTDQKGHASIAAGRSDGVLRVWP
ncbi:MAG: hypothetical protein ACR2GU_10185 [Rubrobacteraceae bacterium]